MDIMAGENNGLENSIKDTSTSLVSYGKETNLPALNSKTNKLITALYMVTDIIDKEEPLRAKLRFAGADILSDMCSVSYRTDAFLINKNINKIAEIVSFLEIASTMRMISEMNYKILIKEFLNLKESLEQHNKPVSIDEFLSSEKEEIFNQNTNLVSSDRSNSNLTEKPNQNFSNNTNNNKNNKEQKEHIAARIGVQKGSTLMKAIKDIGNKNHDNKTVSFRSSVGNIKDNIKANFDDLKRERRSVILKIIKERKQATITDIKMYASGPLASCGDKTLQRELISMVNDGVLKKAGEKRWSRYFL
jgi:hypothetical protein